MDKSLNQAGKPHLIVVVNAVDFRLDESYWKTDVATSLHMDILDKARIDTNSPLGPMAGKIAVEGGPCLDSIGSLLRYFYTTVTVVRLPRTTYLGRMEKQVGELYRAIEAATAQSYREKSQLGAVVSADRIQPLFSAASDQFASNMNDPFDLLAEAWRGIPDPKGMAGGLLHFICTFRKASRQGDYATETVKLLNDLGPLFSSCLLLDAERHGLLGTSHAARRLPPMDHVANASLGITGDAARLFRERYLDCLESTFNSFCAYWLPCAFSRRGRRCRNFQSTHGKGHQGDDGKVMGTSPFQTSLDPARFFPAWTQMIQQGLASAQQELLVRAQNQKQLSRRAVAALIHRRELTRALAYWMQHPSDLVSYKFCLFCACQANPEHLLPCGHVLCTACVETFHDGRADDGPQSRYAVRCPFHPDEQAPALLHVKPAGAGLRILCLDG